MHHLAQIVKEKKSHTLHSCSPSPGLNRPAVCRRVQPDQHAAVVRHGQARHQHRVAGMRVRVLQRVEALHQLDQRVAGLREGVLLCSVVSRKLPKMPMPERRVTYAPNRSAARR